MLERINIENFKSFKNSTIELKKLNLFVGTNSSGKSSAIQSLLILHQNYLKEELCGFNGSYISLGSFIELKNVSSRKIESVCISAEEGEKKYGL